MRELKIGANDANLRLDKFITKAMPTLPQALMYKYIRLKRIKVNGKRAEISTRLCVGDVVSAYINDEFFAEVPKKYDFMSASDKIEVVYEDQNIILVDKRQGLLVHPDDKEYNDTLIARIQHYLYKKGEYHPEDENSFRPALANRIDRNTGGIVIAAKNAEALRILCDKIKLREIDKFYLAAVHGVPKVKSATLEGFLEKNEDKNIVFIKKNKTDENRIIRTKYNVVKENREVYKAESGNQKLPETDCSTEVELQTKPEQITLPTDLLSKDNHKEFNLIGQLFATYWLIEMEEQLFIIDQHAAHEKVLFERTMEKLRNQEEILTQSLMPPMILSLTMREADCLKRNIQTFERLGFAIEEFGGLEFKVTEVPADLVTVDSKELLTEVLNTLLSEREYKNADVLLEKVASLSCKAAVKGNHRMSEAEAKQLISDMLTLDNPYHCPHGRPTTISMSKYELERKFKRIV